MKKRLNHTFLLVSAIIIILMVVLFSFIFYQLLCEEVSESLQNNAVILENALETSDNESEIEKKMNFENLRVTIVDKEGKVIFDNFADTKQMDNHKDRPEIDDALETGEGSCVRHSDTLAKNTFYYALRRTDGTVLRVGKESDSIYSILLEILPEIIAIIALIFVVSWILTLLFAKNIIKPIQRMAEDMDSIEEKDGYKELVPFIRKIKTQHEDIMKSATMRQEFTANVSHELKTPMTSMKVLADSLVGQQGVPEDLYQEFMRDITAEIDRENRIITDLLTLVKMDKKNADLQIQHMSINQLLEDILKRLRPIADKRNIDLILDSFRPVEADVDELKFTSAISNLVENAIKYNVDDGWVRVSLDADHKFFYVTVADSGMGIPEDSLSRIFERFYRVDKSHSREIGGTGLGLAITRSTIGMHHGVIKVFSKEGEGTTFSVRVPLSYIP